MVMVMVDFSAVINNVCESGIAVTPGYDPAEKVHRGSVNALRSVICGLPLGRWDV